MILFGITTALTGGQVSTYSSQLKGAQWLNEYSKLALTGSKMVAILKNMKSFKSQESGIFENMVPSDVPVKP